MKRATLLSSVCTLALLLPGAASFPQTTTSGPQRADSAADDSHQEKKAPNIEKAVVSFRIGRPQWASEKRFRGLLDLFEEYEGVADEISFFHSTTHSPLRLDEVERRCRLLAVRITEARKAGYRAGINVLTTIGHHDEHLAGSLGDEYTRMTDLGGNVCRGSLCPNDPRVRDYVKQLYRLVASAEPDFVWIDDDVRLAGHMPIHLTCFCDNCVSIFAEETGREFSRETLRAAFVQGTHEERLKLRKAWLQHNRDTIGRLFTLIERTVHEVKPGMPLGFMTGDRFYEGYDFDGWARILAGPDKSEVRWRPGGGFYEDQSTSGLAGKSHDVGRQVSMLPPQVVSIQSEIENFPYQRLMKSAHVTALEAASHIAAGCTGAAFNVLSCYDEPLDEYRPLVAKLHRTRPFYDLLARTLGRRELVGIRPAWGKDTAAACDLAGGNWQAYGALVAAYSPKLFEIGLPACYGPGGATVTLLSHDNIVAFDKQEIIRILSSGVYMDTPALVRLNEMGYGELTGFGFERAIAVDCIEEYTDHPLNGPFAGRERDGRQSFNKWPAHVLKPQSDEARSLSRLIDYTDGEIAACTMGVFENRLGGRICVAGYFPWTFLHNLSKSSQIKSVMRWLSKDRLPAYVASFHKINLWVREPHRGTVAVALTNSSFDTAEDLTLLLLTDAETVKVFDMNCAETTIRCSGSDGPYKAFVIPAVDAWQMRLVVAEAQP